MKKIFLLLLVPMCSMAQFTKGDKVIGGSVSFNSQTNSVSTNSNYYGPSQNVAISPSVGYFISEKLSVGIRGGYSRAYQEYINSPQLSYNQQTFTEGIFARRYYAISEKFLFVAEGGFNYSRTTIDYTYNPYSGYLIDNSKYFTIGAQFAPVFIYLPSTHWGIEASLGSIYFNHSYNFISEKEANTFNFSYGTLSLGVAYYFH